VHVCLKERCGSRWVGFWLHGFQFGAKCILNDSHSSGRGPHRRPVFLVQETKVKPESYECWGRIRVMLEGKEAESSLPFCPLTPDWSRQIHVLKRLKTSQPNIRTETELLSKKKTCGWHWLQKLPVNKKENSVREK
jgi:hypothetical protein